MRIILILAMMAVALTFGCEIEPWQSEADPPAAPVQQAAKPIMATVNGEPIYMEQLNDLLVRNYGMQMAQHLVLDMLVDQEARRRGVTVSEDDIRAETDYMLDQITPNPDAGPAERRELLAKMLDEKGLSHADFQRIVRREALGRKMASAEVRIYEADLRNEFDRQYGRQVLVRHIQAESLAAAEEIIRMVRDGADFAELAQRNSLDASSASRGGLIPPIGPRSTDQPAAIRDVAMSLRRPGQLSAVIRTGAAYHLLQLQREIPPRDVSFEDVKDELKVSLLRRTIEIEAKPRLLARLMGDANLKFEDPILQQQYARLDIP